jgi:hypothetical protein
MGPAPGTGPGGPFMGGPLTGGGPPILPRMWGGDVGTSTRLLARVLTGRGSRVDGQVAHAAADLIRHVCCCGSEIGRKLASDFV